MASRRALLRNCEEVGVDSLERTARGKVICPLCLTTGWGDYWWSRRPPNHGIGHRYVWHVKCPRCKKWITTLASHARRCDG